MKINRIEVKNFRALYDFSIDLEDDLSVIVGKNNSGKTSLLNIMDKFLSETKISFDFHDFNKKYIAEDFPLNDLTEIKVEDFLPFCISMKLHIEYDESDYIGNLSKFFLDLNPKSKKALLSFEYIMGYEQYSGAIKDYKKYCASVKKAPRTIRQYVEKNYIKYFKIITKTINPDNLDEFVEIKDKSDIQMIINFKYIKALRDVNNNDSLKSKSQTLSKLALQYYEARKQETIDQSLLDDVLKESDKNLDTSYKAIFKDVIADIERFSYNKSEAQISVKSMLEATALLKESTNVIYSKQEEYLPEEYNGLGYMNLFAMIFYINIQIDEFRRVNKDGQKSADINLLFIEEPEAHTHPQMQYIFIKNIQKKILEGRQGKDGEEEIELQMLLTTHSSHIVSQSEFEKIKFFYLKNDNVYSKNLSELRVKMKRQDDPDENRYKFLKQYLTLNRSELFFANKAIFFEGDTERILLNAMMRKIDNGHQSEEDYVPLLSQNISVIETGAYSHVFDEFIRFLGLKTLVITDLDASLTKIASPCKVGSAKYTSNASLKHFFYGVKFSLLKMYKRKDKVLKKVSNKWIADAKGKVMVTFQSSENGYQASSFEDAFLSINYNFVNNHKYDFQGLKCRDKFDASPDYYKIAAECIDKKTVFATDILYYSDDQFSQWSIPAYIKEGLEWLQK